MIQIRKNHNIIFQMAFFYTPIGANEWENPHSTYLTSDSSWELCTSPRKVPGDVIAERGHVGVVTQSGKTTSASALASPRGLIVENNWGFRAGDNPACWRFNY